VIRVAIVEDQFEIREGLRALIGGTSGFAVSGAYRSMEQALDEFGRETPEVALVDIGLPGMSGIEGTRICKERFPAVRVLVLSIYEDDDRIFRAICAGACGYLLKRTTPARLLEGIQEVFDGGGPMSPEVARRLLEMVRQQRGHAPHRLDLTPHEERLLALLVKGHTYKTAATELGVSVNTVSFHVRKIYDKLHVHSKAEAVAKALREHIVP
jgi:DNA-binding NarL/FixJ family response regulator